MKLNPTNTAIIKRLLVGRNSRPLKSILNRVEPPDLASLFMQLAKVDQGHFIEALVSVQKAGSVFEQLPEGHLTDILSQLDDATLARILKHSLIHQASFLLQFMPSQRHSSLLTQLDWEKREKILQFLNYPEGQCGSDDELLFFFHSPGAQCSTEPRVPPTKSSGGVHLLHFTAWARIRN